MAEWIDACAADDIEAEDVIRFDHGGRTFVDLSATTRTSFSAPMASARMRRCISADGLVMDNTIECPKHDGIFDFSTGEALRIAGLRESEDLPDKVENGRVLIEI